jgi:hypothetical protein
MMVSLPMLLQHCKLEATNFFDTLAFLGELSCSGSSAATNTPRLCPVPGCERRKLLSTGLTRRVYPCCLASSIWRQQVVPKPWYQHVKLYVDVCCSIFTLLPCTSPICTQPTAGCIGHSRSISRAALQTSTLTAPI